LHWTPIKGQSGVEPRAATMEKKREKKEIKLSQTANSSKNAATCAKPQYCITAKLYPEKTP